MNKWILLSQRWGSVVDYGSPMTAWTGLMRKAMSKCNGDTMRARELLFRYRRRFGDERR